MPWSLHYTSAYSVLAVYLIEKISQASGMVQRDKAILVNGVKRRQSRIMRQTDTGTFYDQRRSQKKQDKYIRIILLCVVR